MQQSSHGSSPAQGPLRPPAIEVDDVWVVRDGVTILEAVQAQVPAGGVSAVIGPNGAGKTTLLHAILGLIPYEGRIVVRSERGNRSPAIGYVPQRLDFDRGAPITVLDFLVTSRQRVPVWFGVRPRLREMARQNLARVDALGLLDRRLGVLSGGELQRVQLALALQNDPEIVLLDEPVAGVDVGGERLFCDMLEHIRAQSRLTIVMVSHDLSVVSQHATNVICLNKTVRCQGPAPEVMTAENLSRIYGPHKGLYEHHGELAHAHHEHPVHPPHSIRHAAPPEGSG